MSSDAIAQRNAGFGLGLRMQHFQDFLREPQDVDWLEVITDNYLVDGGKPLHLLDQIRANYPMVMHGVAMSIGAAQGVDDAYLKRVKALADRVQPLWISDHLCWIGPGPEQLHDLYPLPFTDEAARHVVTQIRRAQDVLQRRFVLENVSSYIDYKQSVSSEWQFLNYIAQEADCLLLLDVNNVYVSSVNHGFDPQQYLAGLPVNRIQQIHLAGHSDHGDHIIDTHDHPVAEPVWNLYRQACRMFGNVPTMIERDDNIPELSELMAEVRMARKISAEPVAVVAASVAIPTLRAEPLSQPRPIVQMPLRTTQQRLANYVLARADDAIADQVRAAESVDVLRRLGIYSNAYRARLAEVLADTYAKTLLYMGSDTFDQHARDFAMANPPLVRSLNRYGAQFVDHLRTCYPTSPELWQLAQLDWDLRACFDGADVISMDAAMIEADSAATWLTRRHTLHAGLVMREITMNVVPIWRAIDADVDVPEAVALSASLTLAVWRKALQPHFKTIDAHEAVFLRALTEGNSIAEVAASLEGGPHLANPAALAMWLREWWDDGFLLAV